MARIMVVDDDADSVEVVCKNLEGEGYAVDSACNGRQALERLLQQLPDLVILDLSMPELDGGSLLEIIRSYLRMQTLPVIILTGLTESPMIDRVRRQKVNTILLKGKASLDEITEAVRHELHRAAK